MLDLLIITEQTSDYPPIAIDAFMLIAIAWVIKSNRSVTGVTTVQSDVCNREVI